ncbi:hapless 2 [Trichonephila clavata]|uniref:Hapless 2 n=1 Tax=Trichonephila clavata TaxID=2740835 RepID=A0A8X6H610_TRICU|nr:hapless 2 [Trichonephila clavata]
MTDLISSRFETPEGLEYIYVKEVNDTSTGFNVRLFNPIVIRLRQEQVILAYPFRYLSAVNGKVSEIVINAENTKDYPGCDDTSSVNPTCGKKSERGKSVPFSEGFCCFCPEAPVNKKQTRGGQTCSKLVKPDDFDGQKKKASAHCLQFSDVWYSVSVLSEPVIYHNIFLDVYNQRHLINGSTVWVSLTHGEEFNLGIHNPNQFDENDTIVATFYTSNPKPGMNRISIDQTRLLIPQPMPGVSVTKLHTAVKNGAKDYLLLNKSLVESSGDECDTAGISYRGFALQPDRCEKKLGTCLKNQPLDFWETDQAKKKSGQKGKYLLMNYGTPYKDPIIINKDTKEHLLALEYYEEQLTMLNVEFNADQIVALTPGRFAQISKIISATMEKKILIYVHLTNKGLSPATFYVQATECEYGVLNSKNVSKMVPPQRMEEFVLETKPGVIQLAEKFVCTIVAGSSRYGIVAKREVLIKPDDRCICNRHCKCVCMSESLTCEFVTEEDFHAAGFKASLPESTAKPYRFGKGLFGLFGYKYISYFGLKSRIYGIRRIKHYYEPELKGMNVLYNSEGHPVNPDTKEHVRVYSEEIIFALNTVFFCFWPYIKIADFCYKDTKEEDIYDTSSEEYYYEPGTPGSDTEGSSADGLPDNKYKAAIILLTKKLAQFKEWLMSLGKRKKTEAAPESIDLEPTFESRQSAGDMSSVSTVRKAPLPKMTLSDSILETVPSEPVLSAKQLQQWKKGAQKVIDVIR